MMRARISNRKPPLFLERLEDRLAPATAFWVGDTPTNNWKDRYFDLLGGQDTNWSDDLFPGGKSLVFDSSAVGHLTNNNDFPNVSIESLIFDAPGYTLTGNTLNLTTPTGIWVKSAAGPTDINLGIHFDVSQTWVISMPLEVNGALSGAGGLTKAGAAILTLSEVNTYAGPTVVESGVLEIASASGDVIPGPLVISGTVILLSSHQISDAARVTMDGGVFDLDGSNEDIGSLAGDGTIELADDPTSITADNARLRVGGDNTSTVFSGSINDDQFPLSSTVGGRLVKEGTGTFTLTGNNNYRGETSVNAGTLLVNGVQPRSFIDVDSGATLGGTGVTGPMEIDGTLSPGNGSGPGILTAQGNVDLDADFPDKLAIDLNGLTAGAGYDQLRVLGSLLVDGDIEINLGFTPAVGAKFTIIDNDSTDVVVGSFDDWPEGGTKMVNGNLFHITYKGGDGNDVVLTRTTNFLVSATDAGLAARVRVFDAASKAQRFSFLPYGAMFKGGVRVAVADVNGDAIPDIITAPGPGTPALVKVFSGATAPGQTPQLLYQFKPYANFKGGAFVAAGGDVNGDGRSDIITGPGAGMASLVKIFSGANGALLGSFSAFGGFQGGVTVAAGDVNGDGRLDIIVGMGPGSKPRVRIFDSASRTQIAGPLGNFLAYGASFKGGVFVAAGDVNGDSYADVITGPGVGIAPLVKVFTHDQPTASRVFLAYPAGQKKGVRVAAGDVNGDGVTEILTALGPGGSAEVRLFNNLSTSAIDRIFAEAAAFKKGLFIAG